jgi:hypothetical protein
MAVQNVSGQSLLNFNLTEIATLVFSSTGQYNIQIPSQTGYSFTSATGGALHLDTVHAKAYSLASTTQTINLFDGSLLSPSGAACVFARVRIFMVFVTDTAAAKRINIQAGASSGVLWIPPAANTQWAEPNGGLYTLFDPNAITTAGYLVDTSHKNITFDSLSQTVGFNVLIAGNSSAA